MIPAVAVWDTVCTALAGSVTPGTRVFGSHEQGAHAVASHTLDVLMQLEIQAPVLDTLYLQKEEAYDSWNSAAYGD